MTTKDMHFRSPLRVFEKATDGGLGAGNVGVVLSRAGVGKTAFLVGLAVDAIMHGKKVMHISTEESVEHLRDFYSEIFNVVAEKTNLENKMQEELNLERRRHILVYNRDEFSLEKLQESAKFLKDVAHFEPDIVIMDGTPRYEQSERWEIEGIKKLAQDWNAQVWTASQTHREGQEFDDRGVPAEVAAFDDLISMAVFLEPCSNHVKVKVLKDKNNNAPELSMELDPKNLLLRWR
ncbi:hypothetical protein HN843_08765 [bacterium]|jgi:hypothetical protein|nr:hypothetical protein [bacterium]